MATSRTDYSRKIDWSAVKDARVSMRRQVVRFIHGIKKPRETPVTTKQILAWFHGTPWEFVNQVLQDAVDANEIEFNSSHPHGARSRAGTYTIVETADAKLIRQWEEIDFIVDGLNDRIRDLNVAVKKRDTAALSEEVGACYLAVCGITDLLKTMKP